MHDLNRRLGLTFLFSTHDARLLEHTDRIVRLCDGQVESDSQTKEAAVDKFLLLAFRNIFRNRRRTLMTLMMVGGGVAGLLLAGGYFGFMTHGLRESTINDGLGHIQIFTARSLPPRRSARPRHRHRKLASGCRIHFPPGGHVRGVAPRIEFYGMVSNGTKAAGFMGNAVDPAAEKSPRLFFAHCCGTAILKPSPPAK